MTSAIGRKTKSPGGEKESYGTKRGKWFKTFTRNVTNATNNPSQRNNTVVQIFYATRPGEFEDSYKRKNYRKSPLLERTQKTATVLRSLLLHVV